jgi:hypothetical protein
MKKVPRMTQARAGSQPHCTAMIGPVIGPRDAMDLN